MCDYLRYYVEDGLVRERVKGQRSEAKDKREG